MGQAKQNEIDKQFVKDIREELNVYTAEYKPNQFIDEDVTRYDVFQQLRLAQSIINRVSEYISKSDLDENKSQEIGFAIVDVENDLNFLINNLKVKYE